MALASLTEATNQGQGYPKHVCDEVLRRLHGDFRRLLNFHSIYSLLNSSRLISPSLDQSLLTNPMTTTEKRVDIIVSWLLKCEGDYLTPLVRCLLESASQAGDAHRELADMIKKECQEVNLLAESECSVANEL